MTSNTSTHTMWSSALGHTLSRILQTGGAIVNLSSPCSDIHSTTPPIIPPISLPSPPSVYPRLIALGLQPDLATELSDRYLRNMGEFKRRAELNIHKACSDLAKLPSPTALQPVTEVHDNLLVTFQKLFLQGMQDLADEVLMFASARISHSRQRRMACIEQQRNSSCKGRVPFNQEYVPLLEKYFEHNAYPSTADRAVLARKSMMTDRQIEVWFQNHRNRAKKDGKDLPKLRASDPLPLKLSLESLEQQMGCFIVPESERVDTVDSDISEYETCYDSDEEDVSAWTSRYPRNPCARDTLDVAAPQHAYPNNYPPSCDYDPFPVKHGKFSFSVPSWIRTPAASLVARPPIDFDDFLDDFGKLSVREGPRRHLRKKMPLPPGLPVKPRRTSTPPPKPDRSAATCAITTIPPPAPHPALLRPSISLRVTPPSPVSILPAVPASSSRMHAFHSPSPQSPPATLMPPTQPASVVKKSAGRRKVAPLPRRTPNSASVAHREVTPPTPDNPSPSNSHSPHSRTSSFGSDSSSRTRMSTSSSSSASSTLATPLSSTTSLPETLRSPSPSVSISDFNFNPQNFADIFGGSSIRSLSPVEGLQLDFPSSATFGNASVAKQPFDFNFGAPSTASFVRAQS